MTPNRRRRLSLFVGSVLVVVLTAAGTYVRASSSTPASPAKPVASCPAGFVALTFDDGPGPSTAALLSALKSAGLRATFFDVGTRVRQHPDLVRRTLAEGHAVENHTWDHASLTGASNHRQALTAEQISAELVRTRTEIGSVLTKAPVFWRSPYGDTSPSVQALASRLGMTEVGWTVDSKDYSNVSVARLVATVLAVRPGGVVVMHDAANDRNTIAAIPGIAAGLRARKLCAGRLVASSQGTPGWEHGVFYARPARW